MEPKSKASKETLPKTGKVVPLNMRTTVEVRQRMEEAAKANGRSLASEVEERLLGSFNQDDIQRSMFGGPDLISLFKMMAAAADFIERKTEGTWTADHNTFVAVQAAWKNIIEFGGAGPSEMERLHDGLAAIEIKNLDPGSRPIYPRPPFNFARANDAMHLGSLSPTEVAEKTKQAAKYERQEAAFHKANAEWEVKFENYNNAIREYLEPKRKLMEIGEQAAEKAQELLPIPSREAK